MARWACAIDGGESVDCVDTFGGEETFDRIEDLLVHQATEHERIECAVCGALLPDGYFAIRHMFEDHSRREYVRAYEASPEDVRRREEIRQTVEAEADLAAVVERIERNE